MRKVQLQQGVRGVAAQQAKPEPSSGEMGSQQRDRGYYTSLQPRLKRATLPNASDLSRQPAAALSCWNPTVESSFLFRIFINQRKPCVSTCHCWLHWETV